MEATTSEKTGTGPMIIEPMNEAVHRDDYEEIEDAFRTMAIRAAVALCNLLKLWKAPQ